MYDEQATRLHSVLGRTCWLRVVVLLLHVYLGQFCYVDEYFDTAARKCCSQCQEGEGVKERCTNSTDTVCVECPEQTYSAKTKAGRICKACTSCGPARITTSLCTPTQDTACGSCAVGWFLFISSSGPNQCLKCSPCPPGQEAIHWEECAIVGLAEEYQCKPGDELFQFSSLCCANKKIMLTQPQIIWLLMFILFTMAPPKRGNFPHLVSKTFLQLLLSPRRSVQSHRRVTHQQKWLYSTEQQWSPVQCT